MEKFYQQADEMGRWDKSALLAGGLRNYTGKGTTYQCPPFCPLCKKEKDHIAPQPQAKHIDVTPPLYSPLTFLGNRGDDYYAPYYNPTTFLRNARHRREQQMFQGQTSVAQEVIRQMRANQEQQAKESEPTGQATRNPSKTQPTATLIAKVKAEVEAHIQQGKALQSQVPTSRANQEYQAQGRVLLVQLDQLEKKAERSHQATQSAYLSDNSEIGNQLLEEQLSEKEADLASIRAIKTKLLSTLDTSTQEAEQASPRAVPGDSTHSEKRAEPASIGEAEAEEFQTHPDPIADNTTPSTTSPPQGLTIQLPDRDVLQQNVKQYIQACHRDEQFSQLREQLINLEAKLKVDPTNPTLQELLEEQQQAFQEHPLYGQGIELGLAAEQIRKRAREQADYALLMDSAADHGTSIGQQTIEERRRCLAEENYIRENITIPIREIFNSPSTPPPSRRVAPFVSGAASSAWDTLKGLVNLMKLSGKFGLDALHSLVAWEDKLGLKDGVTSVQEAFDKLCEQTQYDWENPEEYQARLETARAYQEQLENYERAFNAEVYHNKQARALGYISAEAFQAIFGGEIIKGATKLAGKLPPIARLGRGVRGMVQLPKGMTEFVSKHFKAPKGWIQKLANNKKGTRYVNPKRPEDYIRFSEANLHPSAPPGQRVPYFQRHKDGKVLTRTGEWIRKDLADPESYHIPQTMFKKLKHLMDL